MLLEVGPLEKLFKSMGNSIDIARKNLGHDLTATEKILYSHMASVNHRELKRGISNIFLKPDRVAMQDATAQMAILQFISTEIPEVAIPTTIHCDHLIMAYAGADSDLAAAKNTNEEVYDFLMSAAMKYGMGFWEPGSGIIHQVVLENYAVPGTLMIGTDSHTPNAGGLGMIAIGVGGADAVDVMTGQPFMTIMPELLGIKLTGKLSGWTSPKDVILKVASMLSVKGGTGKIIEYFGDGAKSLSATGKGTITNMGAEVGATTSIFPYDESQDKYLRMTDRALIADLCNKFSEHLMPDSDVEKDPGKYYDEVYEINLSTLEPLVTGPHTPDLTRTISNLKSEVDEKGYPEKISAALIGSCTNSSYEDLTRAVSLVRQAKKRGLKIKTRLMVTPGSKKILDTIRRDKILQDFEAVGATVLANACGPCIGQWKRNDVKTGETNAILSSYNRNFARRNDGNPATLSFISSPEVVVAAAFAGSLKFNPLTDTLKDQDGKDFKFDPPVGEVFPRKGFITRESGYMSPTKTGEVIIDPESKRLAFLEPFPKQDPGADYNDLMVLFKAKGKCTTDHISQAGQWLKYRGHLNNISNNLFLGATNAFTGAVGKGTNLITGEKEIELNKIALFYKETERGWVVIGDENIGEGSSREHAAMEPRQRGCRAFISRSYARIFEVNLKKQGILPLIFDNRQDYDKIEEKDKITLEGLANTSPGSKIVMKIDHENGLAETIPLSHTLNSSEIKWFYAGSALNYVKEQSTSGKP